MRNEDATMIRKIYPDTSIIGGYFDEEFAVETQALFERLEKGEVRFVISSVLKQELSKAPAHIQQLLGKYTDDCFEYVELTAEAIELADKYIA
jgi:predicted nucleic acid-binding protein